ncbi:hypothetical protein Tco_0156590 [Tanacetum coccineum]
MTPPSGFSTPPEIPNINTCERPPVTTTVFAATTPENTLFAYRAATLANPNPMISPAFVEANYEMEPRPRPTRETTPTLRSRSPRVCRQRERVVGFEEVSNREGSRAGRNAEGSRPLEIRARENGNMGMNLPPLLAAHLGRNESGQPLQSSLTSVYEGHQPSTNIGGMSLLTLSHLVKGIKKERAKSSENQVEGKKDKGATPTEAPILMIRQKESYTKDNVSEDFISKGKEITFPLITRGSNSSAPVIIKAKVFGREVGRVHMDSGSSCEVIYEHCFMKLQPFIKASKIDSKVPLIGFSGEKSWSSGEIPLEITIGDPLLQEGKP